VEQIRLAVVLGQPVTRTWHKVEQLRRGVQEIQDLRQEEEQQRLAEVAQDSNHGESHAGKVAVGVPNKHLRWISAK